MLNIYIHTDGDKRYHISKCYDGSVIDEFACKVDKRMAELDNRWVKRNKYYKVGTVNQRKYIDTTVDVYYNPKTKDIKYEGVKDELVFMDYRLY